MSHDNHTPEELRIGQLLLELSKRVDAYVKHHTGGDVPTMMTVYCDLLVELVMKADVSEEQFLDGMRECYRVGVEEREAEKRGIN